MTLEEILDYVKNKYSVNLSIVGIGDTMIYIAGTTEKERYI